MTSKDKSPETPEGAGAEYEKDASGSANVHGKASATRAGGDPVNSPVQGNPGESRPDMAYSYGLAAANVGARGAPNQPSQPLVSHQVGGQVVQVVDLNMKDGKPRPGGPLDETEYAVQVRARERGEYNGLREKGDVFDNDRNLPTYPEDPRSWFEDASLDPNWEAIERAKSNKRRSR